MLARRIKRSVAIVKSTKMVIRIFLFLYLFALSTAAISSEKEQWYRDGKPIPVDEMPSNMGLEKGFGAQLALITDESFFKRWATPGGVPSVSTVDTVSKGVLVYAITFFSNPGVVDGYARLSADYKVLNPDGSIYAEHTNLPVLPNNFHFIEDQIYMSVAKLGITFEPQDHLGIYKVISVIRDEIKNAELRLESEILVNY